ncbi:MAG: type II toxin-antitoxin system VapC family toxin [Prevotella sp.]|nr:type II toxin-antitoxin system VapC family toxin [Prevotella sp.]
MRLYLDTNIVVFMLNEDADSLDADTRELLSDSTNVLYTSVMCVQELIHLRQTGKLFQVKRRKKDRTPESMVDMVAQLGIEIVPITDAHLWQLDNLPIVGNHRDPFDRAIIAQAIADRAMLVSTDHEFIHYIQYGLQLHQNYK